MQRQYRIGQRQHSQTAYHPQRGTHQHPHGHQDDELYLVHIAGRARQQVPCLHPVQVAEGERLHFPHYCAAQIGGHILPDPHCQDGVPHRKHSAEDGCPYHDQGCGPYYMHILPGYTLVYRSLGQAGNRQISSTHTKQQHDGQDDVSSVMSYEISHA